MFAEFSLSTIAGICEITRRTFGYAHTTIGKLHLLGKHHPDFGRISYVFAVHYCDKCAHLMVMNKGDGTLEVWPD